MTAGDVDAALRAEDLRWHPYDLEVCDVSQLPEGASGDVCNIYACESYAVAATAKALAPDDVALILRDYVGDPQAEPPVPPDKTLLREMLSA